MTPHASRLSEQIGDHVGMSHEGFLRTIIWEICSMSGDLAQYTESLGNAVRPLYTALRDQIAGFARSRENHMQLRESIASWFPGVGIS